MENQLTAAAGQYLTFDLRNQTFGVAIASVREIIRMIDITPVPQTQSFVSGVINLRGKVIPVIDLRLKFGYESVQSSKETCIIIIEGAESQIGTIVDSVRGVVHLDHSAIEPKPELGADKVAFVVGMGKTDGKIIVLVDAVRALSREELNRVIEIQQKRSA